MHDSSPPSYCVHSPCQHWREASHEDTPSEKTPGSQPVLLSTCTLHLNAQVSSHTSRVDDTIYQKAAAENQRIFESTLWVSRPNFRPLWPPLTLQFQHRPASGYPEPGSFYAQSKPSASTFKSLNLQLCGRVYMYIH